MEVTVENPGGLERRLRVEIPEQHVEGEVATRLQTMARTVRVPGFRPGKVPVKVVAQRYGRQVREEVVSEMVRTSFRDALAQENLRPASNPTIDELKADPGQGIAYRAVFEVYPEVALPVLEGLEVKRPAAEVTETDVDNMIGTLRRQRRTWRPVERAAAKGDRLTVDFTGTADGEPVTGASAEGSTVEIGAGGTMAAFEEGLIGARSGEDLTIDVTFPEDVAEQAVAGRMVHFTVRVHSVEEPVLPDVDEEFVKSFAVPEGTVEAFRAEVRANMERELRDALRAETKRRVMDALLEAGTVELPSGLVEQEIDRIVRERRAGLAMQGIDPEQVMPERGVFEREARRRVALGLLLGEVVKRHGLEADPELVRQRVEAIASTYDEPDQVINWYYGNQERLAELETAVLEDQVVDWLLERVNVAEEPLTFDDLLNPGQTSKRDVDD